MVLGIGIVLLVVLAAAVAYVVAGMPDGTVQIEGFLFDVEVSPLHLFLVGIGTALLFAFALWLTIVGARRYRAKQKELHELRRAAADRHAATPSDKTRGADQDSGRDERRRPVGSTPGATKDRPDPAERPVTGDRHEVPSARERRRPTAADDDVPDTFSSSRGNGAPRGQAWPDESGNDRV